MVNKKLLKIYTIGFTQKTAEAFFELLSEHEIQCLVDIRLHPDGQLSGFAKRDDLRYFLKELIGCSYLHEPLLCPTEEILKAYRSDHDWVKFLRDFDQLMEFRGIPESLDRALFEGERCCLLCSEALPEKCHRSMVADRMQRGWGDVKIVHLI